MLVAKLPAAAARASDAEKAVRNLLGDGSLGQRLEPAASIHSDAPGCTQLGNPPQLVENFAEFNCSL